MAEMLLINPRRRPKARKTAAKKRRVRRNPVAALAAKPTRRPRRRNPIGLGRVRHAVRRRRNPINTSGITAMLKTALMGGAGAVAVDVMMGQLIPFLPVSMQPGAAGDTTVGTYDAVKLAATIAAGEVLNKATKGMSRKLAAGALTVQSYQILRTFMPSTMSMGFMSPANVIRGTSRIAPNMSRMAAYQSGGQTALLSGTAAYQTPGRGSLLSGARVREGQLVR